MMDLITLIALALGLSFDTFAVSLSCGVLKSRIRFIEALKIAIVMAVFQGGLPVAGYFLGSVISDYVRLFDHWLALLLLGFLGVRMIIEGLRTNPESQARDITKPGILFAMALGTSVDAFAVGISMALLNVAIWSTALIIGAITFLASMVAIRIGKGAGSKLGSRIEIFGGVILILIGLKIVIEHTIL